jgi:hypothetical protein
MRLVKRGDYVNPLASITIWLIPTFFYTIQKMLRIIIPEREWMWWVMIPTTFIIWVLLNWKIKK